MIEDASCGDLKGYISRCRFLVAARTHASIAAYSTGVPALVAGYSVKARGDCPRPVRNGGGARGSGAVAGRPG